MIQLITKEEFKKNINTAEFSKILCKLTVYNNDDFISMPLYILCNGIYLIYIEQLGAVLVHKRYDLEQVRTLLKGEEKIIYTTDWEVIKQSEEVAYSLNAFSKVYSYVRLHRGVIGDKEKGSWNLINRRTGEVIEFQMNDKILNWWEITETSPNPRNRCIAYEEKDASPSNNYKIKEKDKFIELILNGCKKSNESTSITSK